MSGLRWALTHHSRHGGLAGTVLHAMAHSMVVRAVGHAFRHAPGVMVAITAVVISAVAWLYLRQRRPHEDR